MAAGAAVMVGSTIFKLVNEAVEKSKARKAAEEHYARESASSGPKAADQSATDTSTVSADEKCDESAGSTGSADVSRENLKYVKYHPNCIGIDVGSSNSKVVLKSWTDNTTPGGIRWDEVRSIIENTEGGRVTPTALYISPEDDGFYVGEFAKAKQFSKPRSTRCGLYVGPAEDLHRHHFAAECARVLPLHFHDVPGSTFEQFSPSTVVSAMLATHLTKAACYKLATTDHGESEMDPNGLCINIGVSNENSTKHNESIAALTRRLLGADSADLQINTVVDSVSAVRGAETLGLLATSTDFDEGAGAGVTAAGAPIVEGEFVVVVDIGGATAQLAVLQWGQEVVSPPDWEVARTVGAPTRILERTLRGGGCEAVDELLVQELASAFAHETGVDLLQDPLARQRLHNAATQARTELCARAETAISLPFITADTSGPKHLDHSLTRSALDRICCDVLAAVHSEVDLLLEDLAQLTGVHAGAVVANGSQIINAPSLSLAADGGKLQSPSVHTAILTGGGIRVPYIAADLKKQLTHKLVAINGRLSADDRDVHVAIPERPEELNCMGISTILTYR